MSTMNFACSLTAENYLGLYFSHFRLLITSGFCTYLTLLLQIWLCCVMITLTCTFGCSVFPFQDKWGPHSFQCALFPKGFPFKEGSGTLGDPSVNLGPLFCLRSPFSIFWRKNAKQQLWKPVSFVDHTRQLVVFDGQTLCLKVCFNSVSW